jgi:hypothetical protein
MPPEINTRAKPFTAWYRKLRPGDLSGKLYPDVAYRRNAMFSSILGHYAVNEWKG